MRPDLLTRRLRRASLGLAVLLLTITTAATPARLAETPAVSIKNFGRVNDHYYRGSQPTREQFEQLQRLGIKTVIDLRKDNVRAAADWVRGLGMQYFNIPLKASVPPTEEQTSYFLSLVNNPANWPVYIHCKGGRHRTGALTAIYRITKDGWTADQAFKEMEAYDFNDGLFGGPVAQKKYVYSFYESHRRKAATEQK